MPLLIFLFIVACILLIVFIQYIIEIYLITSSQEEELLGVEGLVRFYKSLFKSDLDYWIHEEMALRNQNVSYLVVKCFRGSRN